MGKKYELYVELDEGNNYPLVYPEDIPEGFTYYKELCQALYAKGYVEDVYVYEEHDLTDEEYYLTEFDDPWLDMMDMAKRKGDLDWLKSQCLEYLEDEGIHVEREDLVLYW